MNIQRYSPLQEQPINDYDDFLYINTFRFLGLGITSALALSCIKSAEDAFYQTHFNRNLHKRIFYSFQTLSSGALACCSMATIKYLLVQSTAELDDTTKAAEHLMKFLPLLTVTVGFEVGKLSLYVFRSLHLNR